MGNPYLEQTARKLHSLVEQSKEEYASSVCPRPIVRYRPVKTRDVLDAFCLLFDEAPLLTSTIPAKEVSWLADRLLSETAKWPPVDTQER